MMKHLIAASLFTLLATFTTSAFAVDLSETPQAPTSDETSVSTGTSDGPDAAHQHDLSAASYFSDDGNSCTSAWCRGMNRIAGDIAAGKLKAFNSTDAYDCTSIKDIFHMECTTDGTSAMQARYGSADIKTIGGAASASATPIVAVPQAIVVTDAVLPAVVPVPQERPVLVSATVPELKKTKTSGIIHTADGDFYCSHIDTVSGWLGGPKCAEGSVMEKVSNEGPEHRSTDVNEGPVKRRTGLFGGFFGN